MREIQPEQIDARPNHFFENIGAGRRWAESGDDFGVFWLVIQLNAYRAILGASILHFVVVLGYN